MQYESMNLFNLISVHLNAEEFFLSSETFEFSHLQFSENPQQSLDTLANIA